MKNTIATTFIAGRMPIDAVETSENRGIYCVFAKTDCLFDISLPDNRVLFIGWAGNLAKRNPYLTGTDVHTLRRSLGAILQIPLKLYPIPRAADEPPSNYKNYTFAKSGEARLTRWIRDNLDYASIEMKGSRAVLMQTVEEVALELKPSLNLDLIRWANPQKQYIWQLRRDCRKQARNEWRKKYPGKYPPRGKT